jgi:hypothetical protein
MSQGPFVRVRGAREHNRPVVGLAKVGDSVTRRFLFGPGMADVRDRTPRLPEGWPHPRGISAPSPRIRTTSR